MCVRIWINRRKNDQRLSKSRAFLKPQTNTHNEHMCFPNNPNMHNLKHIVRILWYTMSCCCCCVFSLIYCTRLLILKCMIVKVNVWTQLHLQCIHVTYFSTCAVHVCVSSAMNIIYKYIEEVYDSMNANQNREEKRNTNMFIEISIRKINL